MRRLKRPKKHLGFIIRKAGPNGPDFWRDAGRHVFNASGASNEVGAAIVKHPLIKAVGFTGSFNGGKALYDIAISQPEPIPVYAEMGSTNPIFVLPGALKEQGEEVAEDLACSVNLGVGQFCTNPGLVAYEDSNAAQKFRQALTEHFKKMGSGTMLTSAIQAAYTERVEKLLNQEGVQRLANGEKMVRRMQA